MAYTITMTQETYSPTDSGKRWRSKPDDVHTETLTEEQYKNMVNVDTMKFFRSIGGSETASRGYTSMGYNVVRLVSCNPDRTVKKVREFDIKYNAPVWTK